MKKYIKKLNNFINDFDNNGVLLFILLNTTFSIFLLFNYIFSGILLLFLSITIVLLHIFKYKKKTIKLAEHKIQSDGLQRIFSYIPFNVVITDLNNNILFSNCQSSYNQTPNDYMKFDSLCLLDNTSKINKIKINNKIEYFFSHKNAISSSDNKAIGYINIELNITDILQYYDRINTLNPNIDKYLYTAFDSNNDGILIFGYDSAKKESKECLISNTTIKNMIFTNNIGNDLLSLFHKSERNRVGYIIANLTNEPILFESLMLSRYSHFPVEINASIIKIKDKSAIYLSIRNIQLRKELEDKRNANRILLIAKNNVASMVYVLHLVLTKIYEHINTTKEYSNNILNLHSDIKDKANAIMNAQEKILNSIRELILFYNKSNIKTFVNIKSLIEHIKSTIYTKEVINNISITIIQKGEVKDIYCDEGVLKFVIISIINNSIEHTNITKGTNFYGNIDITIENLNNNFIKISIEDNAGGVDVGCLERIFDAFYSTKETKIGLGLTSSKIIVEQILFGSIKADNTSKGLKMDISISTMG
ncbi:ATP-binding protein [Helicobacter sp. MIT 14-3879]|uniref:ATP-binding protein n=1 Tax=Helicobacter sp. MIT 14-3879 TaxID=2040649 RepID=UPI000E1E31D3|nr:ATP-binding protein [Helicobacter sp. MIT 14-3879]RDU63473.1 hypothetical protein CQA44_05125 [Helicobacter sp. MIT 14-3879]